jgi:excisionase family DNA binding protein
MTNMNVSERRVLGNDFRKLPTFYQNVHPDFSIGGNMNCNTILGSDILLRASEVARRLNISRSLAYQLIQTGKIPVIRINHSVRVRMVDLEEFIQTHRSGCKERT